MMKLDFIDEPELEFGGLRRHIDIRSGLSSFGPLDALEGQPRRIRIGIVGTQQTVDGIQRWLEKCRGGIEAKQSRQPNLFPSFPGFGAKSPFQADFELAPNHVRTLSQRDLNRVALQSHYAALTDGVALVTNEVRAINESGRPDVVIVAMPLELVGLEDDEESERTDELRPPDSQARSASAAEKSEVDYASDLDLRHMLKAEVMKLNQPIQLVLPSTYGDGMKANAKASARPSKGRLQDEATRAWNFHTALYYKANYQPWRMVRSSSQLHTCFVGVSFYRSLDRSNLMTSMAQVYDERGDGVIVRGKPVELSKDDRQPHLSSEDAFMLLSGALKAYREEHKHAPARVVVHKSSSYNVAELDGFNRVVDAHHLETADFLVVGRAFTRLFRPGVYPPLRGELLSLDERTHVLYTRGSVPYYSTYPGMYVPRPLKFQIVQADESPRRLAEELLALTKLNWNNTQFDGGEPITMRVARQVGKVLKYVRHDGVVQPRYSFYM
jgi:hypothetical protein